MTRSAHLDAEEIEFMRWRAERWMKVRHMPAAFRHYPGFVLRHARADDGAHVPRHDVAIAPRPRESARDAFRRYEQIRAQRTRVSGLAGPTRVRREPLMS